MILKTFIKIKILIKQNDAAFLMVLIWFIFNYFYFYFATNSFFESFLIIFFFKIHDSYYGSFYDAFTEFIIFGLVFGLFTVELFRKYNPVVTSRELSKRYSDHVVIIGYTNIGKRIADYLKENNIKYVIIEEDYDLIEELIIKEEAVINDTPLSTSTLEDAGIREAKAVFISSDNFEIQLVANYNIRKLNPSCKIVARIFEDDIAELISKTYNTEIISTSKYASEVIFEKVKSGKYQNILLIGLNHISIRLIKKFQLESGLKYCLIEEKEEIIDDYLEDRSYIICGDPKEVKYLELAKIREIDCVINTESDVKNSILVIRRLRELNNKCKIISRVFLESVAEILENPPFVSEIISSSKGTLEIMIKKGMFKF